MVAEGYKLRTKVPNDFHPEIWLNFDPILPNKEGNGRNNSPRNGSIYAEQEDARRSLHIPICLVPIFINRSLKNDAGNYN